MSKINKLDNTDLNCPFNPDQYKKKVDVEVDGVPPIGSLPWALIQVYLGKVVSRSSWDDSNEYIQLTTKSDGSAPVHIEKHDQQSFPYDWEPTPEDLISCDWQLVKIEPKPVGCMLSFDLKIGTAQYNSGRDQDWGYAQGSYGTLTNFQSTIGIRIIEMFRLFDPLIDNSQEIDLSVDTQNQPDLYRKNLEVMVDGSTYHLGASRNSTANTITTDFVYELGDAKKLGDLMKQNLDKTLRFCFNWK
ncbi:Thoeris anti-defense Tad2 family protein [Xenorhabdus doucetiae]|uniref:Uncharacterized protein DUF2829 n=1 Tax=Xenorhabdus doucetiae TaxID=351671 RepID=A0A068QRD1_9GAMM|nr:MW1434 family type I TA system toxin [Xenorhabdus doucetiae]TYP17227.1 uncharacterized protein DUF2829 [Xenorhabdus doucetiae]CDG17329.1 conserved protein of unknown function [Xenorhabdus doucetiae]